MQEHKLLFGRLNSDSGDYALPQNDYLNGRNINILTAEGQDVGDIIGVTGNVKLRFSGDPYVNGEHRVVGSYADEPRERIVYFLAPLGGEEASWIVVYDKNASRNYIALYGDAFLDGTRWELDPDVLIHSITMEGNLLFWTDGVNPPMKYNLDRGLKFNNSGYDTNEEPYGFMQSVSDLWLAREAPIFPPFLDSKSPFGSDNEWGEDAYDGYVYKEGYRVKSTKGDLIGNESLLFATRFIYNDGEISTLSPYTHIVQPAPDRLKEYSGIKVKYVETSSIPFDVEYVELVVKYGNSGAAYIIDRVTAADYPTASYTFFNDSVGAALSDEYTSKDFESVPLISQTLDSIDNRLILGNNTDSYDTPSETSLTISPYYVREEGLSSNPSKDIAVSAFVII